VSSWVGLIKLTTAFGVDFFSVFGRAPAFTCWLFLFVSLFAEWSFSVAVSRSITPFGACLALFRLIIRFTWGLLLITSLFNESL